MAKVTSSIKTELYKIEIKSPSGNVIIADEPVDLGGKDLGFSPKELLASALAACTNATVKMYADRKAWDLHEVRTDVELDYIKVENKTVVKKKMDFIGNLDAAQKKRLLAIAKACPIQKILSNEIEINSEVV